MRIVFIGAVEFSRRALQLLVALRSNVVGVCTLEHSAFNADHADLRALCETHGLPWKYTPDVNAPESIEWIVSHRPDVIFCFGWSRLLKSALLQIAPLGVVGFHPAALPANRGRHPLIWALALGLTETASTFFFMDEGADRGDILSQSRIEIDDTDDAATLYEKIVQHSLRQIQDFLPQLASGVAPRRQQDEKLSSTWRKRGRADGQIDWRMSSLTIHNLVRALTKPYIGAHLSYRGTDVKVWRTMLVADVPLNAEPGKVIMVDEGGAIVKCGEHGIRLVKTEPAFAPSVGEYL